MYVESLIIVVALLVVWWVPLVNKFTSTTNKHSEISQYKFISYKLRIIHITLSSDHQEVCRVFSSHCGNQPVLPRRQSPSFIGTASDRGWKLHPQDGCRVSSKKRAADISHQQLWHDVGRTTGMTMLVEILKKNLKI